LTSIVCHELNNSLNGIVLQTALMEQAASDRTRAEILNVRKLATEAADLIKKLQKYNRFHSVELEPVDVNELARSAQKMLQERYPEAHIKLQLAHGPCHVQSDASTLQRILLLLGWHSVSVASAAKPQITITTRASGNKCLMTWHDNGPAVAEADLERLFDTFHTVREGSDEVSLPVIRLLARRLRGHINAARAPAGGLDFNLELPPA
jgi:C4-dicarboxylate-specific signal transduction histidine kinase